LSGRGLCDELITRPVESYRLCCVVVFDLETSRMGAPYTYIYDISRLRVNFGQRQLQINYSIRYQVPRPNNICVYSLWVGLLDIFDLQPIMYMSINGEVSLDLWSSFFSSAKKTFLIVRTSFILKQFWRNRCWKWKAIRKRNWSKWKGVAGGRREVWQKSFKLKRWC